MNSLLKNSKAIGQKFTILKDTPVYLHSCTILHSSKYSTEIQYSCDKPIFILKKNSTFIIGTIHIESSWANGCGSYKFFELFVTKEKGKYKKIKIDFSSIFNNSYNRNNMFTKLFSHIKFENKYVGLFLYNIYNIDGIGLGGTIYNNFDINTIIYYVLFYNNLIN